MSIQIPTRGQRKRTKGWTAPEGALYVGRPSQWGNPWRIKGVARGHVVIHEPVTGRARSVVGTYDTVEEAAARAVQEYREYLAGQSELWLYGRLQPLYGKILLCWCPLGQECHVDVLIEYATAYLNEGRDSTYTFKTWSTGMVAS
jgi:hypothetical protein